MTRTSFILAAGVVGVLAAGFVLSVPARAQSAAVVQAMAAGTVGEQADGYLGIAGSVSADVKSEVDGINIKRRAVYTDLASKRGVTVSDMAAATGCQTLASRVKDGQKYRTDSGAWQTKSGAIALPAYCATAG